MQLSWGISGMCLLRSFASGTCRVKGYGLFISLFLALACNGGAQVTGPAGSSHGKSANAKHKEKDPDALGTDEDIFDQEGGLREESSLGDLASGTPAAKKIDYPKLDLHGNGSLSCKGKRYDTVAKYRVNLDATVVNLDFYDGRVVNAGSTVEDRANPKIAASLGLTTYQRPSKEDHASLVSSGFIWAPYALFAKSALKTKQGQNFTINPPLPFFPLPAKATRYDELKSGLKSWTSEVTGGPNGSFTATVSISLGGMVGDEVTLLFSLTIPQDTDRQIYESFPVPKEATYVVNTKSLDIRRISTTNWYRGDSACDGRPEDIQVNYNLCQKTIGSKDEVYSCSN